MFKKYIFPVLALTMASVFSACGGNNTNAEAQTTTDTAAVAATDEPAPAPNNDPACTIKAKIGADKEWVAHSMNITRVAEHLTIAYDGDGDYDPKDISGLQIQIHNFNGPGTYTYTGDGNVSILIELKRNVGYLTAAPGSSGTVIISEYSPTALKATFQFKAGKSDATREMLEVTAGEVIAKNEAGGCSVAEVEPMGK